MVDPNRPTPAEDPHFGTDAVQADRAREQGLGLGERELEAQRDPGGVRTANIDDEVEGDGIDDDGAEAPEEDRASSNAT